MVIPFNMSLNLKSIEDEINTIYTDIIHQVNDFNADKDLFIKNRHMWRLNRIRQLKQQFPTASDNDIYIEIAAEMENYQTQIELPKLRRLQEHAIAASNKYNELLMQQYSYAQMIDQLSLLNLNKNVAELKQRKHDVDVVIQQLSHISL
jgi:hypothetical protein